MPMPPNYIEASYVATYVLNKLATMLMIYCITESFSLFENCPVN